MTVRDVPSAPIAAPEAKPAPARTRSWQRARATWLPVILVGLLCLPALAPLFHPEYFWGAHDARHSVYFLVEFERSFRDGVWYPRWAPDFAFGYGYPIFNIYGPLSYFAGEAFRLIGLDFVAAVKAVFGLALVGSALAMYLFAADLWGRRAAVLAALLYVYAPYRLVDLYVRGALAEHVAFVWLPLALWAGRQAIRNAGRAAWHAPATLRSVALTGLTLAALIMTHQGICFLFLLAAVPYWLVMLVWPGGVPRGRASWRRVGRGLLALVAGGALAVGLAAIFLLPALLEYSSVRVDQWTTNDYDLTANFVYLHQLISPLWGYGTSIPGPDDRLSFQLGLPHVVLAVLALAAAAGLREAGRPVLMLTPSQRAGLVALALVALGAVLLMLPISLVIWQRVPFVSVIQFPWRFLTLTALALSVVGAAVARIRTVEAPASPALLVALVLATVLAAYPYLQTPEEIFRPAAEGPVSLAGLMRFQQSSGELVGLTRWNTEKPTDSPLFYVYLQGIIPTDKVERRTLPPGAEVVTTRHTTTLDEVEIQTPAPARLTFLTQMYPGWTAYLDGRPVPIQPSEKLGLITVEVPPGRHTVRVVFEETWPRRVGTVLSGLTGLLLVGYALGQGVRRLRRRGRRGTISRATGRV